MNRSTCSRTVIVLTMVFSSLASVGRAEIAARSRKKLTSMASHIVTGEVKHVFSRKERKGNFEFTHFVAEVAVDKVSKGQDILAKDRVYVRSWRKKWLGKKEETPTDPYGHFVQPKQGDHVTVFVKGDRSIGYNVLYPNGFSKVKSPKK